MLGSRLFDAAPRAEVLVSAAEPKKAVMGLTKHGPGQRGKLCSGLSHKAVACKSNTNESTTSMK